MTENLQVKKIILNLYKKLEYNYVNYKFRYKIYK